jgi:phosphoenolpyruvate-protein phosphotransferase (PTS system enzyme I)
MSVSTVQAERRFQGVAVSPGIAKGRAWVHRTDEETVPCYRVEAKKIDAELQRLESALLNTRSQIQELQQRISSSIGDESASIFDAHLLVVDDRSLIDEVVRTIKKDRINAESVFTTVSGRYIKTLSEINDPYLRERAVDIHDVCRRVVCNLTGGVNRDLTAEVGGERRILIAHNLAPSDTAQLNPETVLGFATDVGSKTSHTAIMARSLNIPAVVALHDISLQVETGENLLLDGYTGLIVVNPSETTLLEYAEIEQQKGKVELELGNLRETECKTLDGRHVVLSANIEMPRDVAVVRQSGAEGVGLFRTEFLYLNSEELPSEQVQFEAYQSVVSQLAPAPVIIRTLDLGGDKIMSSLNLPQELNPFLGWRAIRFCLERVEVFKTQLRAILRASAHGHVRMMYPMISGVEEVRKANAMLAECQAELRQEGIAFDEKMQVGAMIEIPSAAISADLIAREVDFFSIGTNDLIQYTIAVDRLNERIAHLYEPTHPAILRLIRMVVEAARAQGIWVGVCGEMAGEVTLTPLLLGLGVDELSTGASLVPRVKAAVQQLSLEECQKLAQVAAGLDSAAAVYSACDAVARAHYPELL